MWSRHFPTPDAARTAARWALVALAVHLVAAFRSLGWNHLDEHFQVLEFANAMLGRTPRELLAWEYPAQMRPALQPAFYALVARAWLGLGVDNPFTWAASFRVLSALLSWTALVALALAAARGFAGRAAARWVWPTFALTWFLPYLHARTSSENVSAALVLLGLSWLWWRLGPGLAREGERALPLPDALGVGLLLGLAFEVRYQVGVMVAGVGLWALFVRRVRRAGLVGLTAGLLVAVAVGTAVDRWFYGSWVFAPWNYLRINVFEHKAASFGVSPWWMYFPKIIERAGPPFSVALAAGTAWAWFRQPRSLLTWATAPFLLVHCALSHKEMRFLYPMVVPCLVLALDSVEGWWARVPERWRTRGGVRGLLRLLLAADVALLAVAASRSAQPLAELHAHLYATRSEKAVVYFTGLNPKDLSGNLPFLYYWPPGVEARRFEPSVADAELVAVASQFDAPGPLLAAGYACEPAFHTMPAWWRRLDFNGWVKRAGVWTEFRCRRVP
jgi:phosphatidylinositol glycan class B